MLTFDFHFISSCFAILLPIDYTNQYGSNQTLILLAVNRKVVKKKTKNLDKNYCHRLP